MKIYENTTYEFASKMSNVKTIILPIGSFEQHSAHMCLGTDFLIANSVAKGISERLNVIVLPPIIYGVSEAHKKFNGTIYIKPTHFYEYIHDIIESLKKENFDNVLIINGHGANWFATDKVCKVFKKDFKHIEVLQWWELLKNEFFSQEECSHAGAQELSVLGSINPDYVRLDKVENQVKNKDLCEVEREDICELTFNGVVGIAKTYDIDKGKVAFKRVVDKFCEIINEWEREIS